jgi:hypothetical protein
MKIDVELDDFEVDTLASLLHTEIRKNTAEAKLQFLTKEISKERLEWHESHADFLKVIYNKLFTRK